jgi:hypothetical protein
VGHLSVETRLLAHTTFGGVSSAAGIHAQRRLNSRPACLQLSHFHAAWFEYWK